MGEGPCASTTPADRSARRVHTLLCANARLVLMKNGGGDFDYHGGHRELLLARLTDQQCNDAFRAAAYPGGVRRRYISKLKLKIQEGLAFETRAATTQ